MPQKSPRPPRYSPFARLVGLDSLTYEEGCGRCSLQINENSMNINGTVHGGAIYTMTDVAMGTALYAILDADERCSTIETNISYFVAATSGLLTCESRVIHKTRKLAVVEAEVKNDGRSIAKATGTFYISRAKQA